MKTYETPNTLSQAIANLEDELAYYKEKVQVLERFKNFDATTVARAAELTVDNHLRTQAPESYLDMKQVYEDAGFDIKSPAFHNAVLWITMRWSSRDRKGEEDMLEYFIIEMPRTYLLYLHDSESMDHEAIFKMQRELSEALRMSLLKAEQLHPYRY